MCLTHRLTHFALAGVLVLLFSSQARAADPGLQIDLAITKTGPATIAAGADATYTLVVTNNSAALTSDATVTDTLPAGFIVVSANAPGVSCSGVGTGVATCTMNLPPLASVTITVVAHVPGVCQAATAINTATVTPNSLPDSNPANNTASFTTAVTQVNLGSGQCIPPAAEISDDKPGSILFYSFYTSSVADSIQTNTRISLTNTNPNQGVAMHLFFVDGATCSVADAFLCLTANQTATFLMSDIDPGTSGYIIAVASDGPPGFGDGNNTGCPVSFNYLIGHESIKLPVTGSSFASFGNSVLVPTKAKRVETELAAESIAAQFGSPVPGCNGSSVTAELRFDGTPTGYNRLPRVLAASNIPSRADGNSTLLIINRVGGSLATGAATLGTLFGILYDDAENGYSFQLSGACQLRGELSNNFPRTAPRFDQLIPAGRSGWLKIYGLADIAIIGALINNNVNFDTAANAFDGGHMLHKLTLTSSAVLTVPIFPPNC